MARKYNGTKQQTMGHSGSGKFFYYGSNRAPFETNNPFIPNKAQHDMSRLDSKSLRAMNRTTLQRLAKKHGIKANLKQEVIIDLLLQQQAVKTSAPKLSPPTVLPPKLQKLRARRRRSPTPGANLVSRKGSKKLIRSSQRTDLAVPVQPEAPTTPATQETSVESNDPLPDQDQSSGHAGGTQTEIQPHEDTQSVWSVEDYQWATPESSRANTPEPEAEPELLKTTVDHMAQIEANTTKMREQVQNCRQMIFVLKQRAVALRSAAQAERACSERLKTYFAHWQKTKPRWSYEEIWAGQMRIDVTTNREITESDEEEPEEPETTEPSKQIPARQKGALDSADAEQPADTESLSALLDHLLGQDLAQQSSGPAQEDEAKAFDYLFTGPEESRSKFANLAVMLERDSNPIVSRLAPQAKKAAIRHEKERLAKLNISSKSRKRTATEASLDAFPEEDSRRSSRRKTSKEPPPSSVYPTFELPHPGTTRLHLILDRMEVPRLPPFTEARPNGQAPTTNSVEHQIPAPSIPRIDKGKRKMTAQEVERMQQEEMDHDLALRLATGPQDVTFKS